MTILSGNPISNQDDALADFVDRLRADGSAALASSADNELRGLEETLLHLNRAFPREAINEEVIKRMQADFRIRKRRQEAQEQAGRPTWWNSIFQSPLAMAVVACAVIGVFAFLATSFTGIGSSMSGTAGMQAGPIGFLIGFGLILVLVALWLGRRK
jgi:hypothetical protein